MPLTAEARSRLRVVFACALGLSWLSHGASSLGQGREGFAAGQNVPAAYDLTWFYDAPRDLRRFRMGDVIKSEPIAAPKGAQAWRVMYLSSTEDGRPTPTTGLIIAPLGKAHGPRPVLAWAHGTTGAARGCAPSLAQNPAREFLTRGGVNPVDIGVPYLSDFLARGYVVAATDYQGLGGPGRHQFLIGDTTARGVLDMARAAGRLPAAGAGSHVSVLGWSQGGQAALFAGEIGRTYAPDLQLDGIATLAPSTGLMSPVVDKLFRSDIPQIYLIADGFTAAYGLPTTAFTPRGHRLMRVAATSCILEVFKQASASKGAGVNADITDIPGWVPALIRNQAGLRRSAAPILIVHGTADTIVAPAGTPFYADRARTAGSQVVVSWIEGGDHRSIMTTGKARILTWLDDRRVGTVDEALSDQREAPKYSQNLTPLRRAPPAKNRAKTTPGADPGSPLGQV